MILQLTLLAAALCADPLPVSTSMEVPNLEAPPRTRAVDTIGEAKRKKAGELPRVLPQTAPSTYETASALAFPDPDDFDLAFPSDRPGWYSAPDGGRVYLWKKENWSWETQGGAKIVRWPNGTSVIQVGAHQIVKFPDREWPGTVEWTFPDQTKLRRHPWPAENTVLFAYESKNPRSAYGMWAPGKWAPLQMEFGRYRIHYSQAWADHLEALQAWGKTDEFFDLMEKLFAFKNPGPIPVVFFQEIDGMRRQLRDESASEGGRGGMFGISICCGNKRSAFSSVAPVREAQIKNESFGVLLHETVHNLQQHRCFYVRGGRDLPPVRDPGPWFVEGIAETGMMQMLPRQRARKYRELFAKLESPQSVRFENVGYADGSVYMYGTFMLEYVMRTRGPSAVRAFYDDVCIGSAPDESARKHLGGAPPDLLEQSIAYFRTGRQSMESEIAAWELAELAEIPYAESSGDRLSRLQLPSAVRSIQSIPGLSGMRMQTRELEGNFEGTLKGPGEERVYLWKNGTYQVTAGNLKITYFKDGSAVLSTAGHTINEWPGNVRKWTLPDGTSALQRGNNIEYIDAQGKKIP